MKHQKLIIVIYRICGRGNMLVDPKRAFGVKGPLRMSIILENLFFVQSSNMVE